MRYLIAYDIADDRRRSRLAAKLLNFGARLEESVFIANVTQERLEQLREEIDSEIAPLEDAVHLVPLCEACWRRVEVKGTGSIPRDLPFYVI